MDGGTQSTKLIYLFYDYIYYIYIKGGRVRSNLLMYVIVL